MISKKVSADITEISIVNEKYVLGESEEKMCNAVTKHKHMATNKGDLFEKELQERAFLFKALGHPARLAILKYLADIKTCICGDISDELPLSRTTVNQHLKELKKVGLISGTVDGVKTNYCINPRRVEWLKKTLSAFVEEIKIETGSIETEKDCC